MVNRTSGEKNRPNYRALAQSVSIKMSSKSRILEWNFQGLLTVRSCKEANFLY